MLVQRVDVSSDVVREWLLAKIHGELLEWRMDTHNGKQRGGNITEAYP